MAGAPVDLRAIVRAALLAPSPLQRYWGGRARAESHDGIGLVALGPPGHAFNFAVVFEPAPLGHVLDLATTFFGDPSGYAVTLEVGSTGTLGDTLLARGWRLDEEEVALVLPRLPSRAPDLPSSLAIRRVDSDQALHDFSAAQGAPSTFLPSLAAARDPGVAAFVGYDHGRPVATSRLVCLDRIAEITGVVTLPAYRRRGFGMALTWAAAVEGQSRACGAATLMATPMGHPLYVRMGFVPVDTYRTYVQGPTWSGHVPSLVPGA